MLHFNLADYPVNFFEQFVSCLDIMKNIAYHFMEVLIFYTDKLMVMAIPQIRVYIISRFYSDREDLMIAKYMWFTVIRVIDV